MAMAMLASVVGCETWKGLGRDMEEAGEEMQES